jgi:adenosylcobinamide kinase / adenosylcobinamide-phosphate guanylyltransferase
LDQHERMVPPRLAEGLPMAVTLVTGPVRSGKSRYVVALAQASGLPVRYVATAMRDSADAEWAARLDRHVRDRPAGWETIESASLSPQALLELFHRASEQDCIVVDALGTWLATRIAANIDAVERNVAAFEARIDAEATDLALAMLASRALVVVVTEEVGWDVVPVAASARLFRDVLGRMKQQLAARAQAAVLIVCGIALDLRALGTPLES